jgi:hypothetical protein
MKTATRMVALTLGVLVLLVWGGLAVMVTE